MPEPKSNPYEARRPVSSDDYVKAIVAEQEKQQDESVIEPDHPVQRQISGIINEAVLGEVEAQAQHIVNPRADDERGERLLAEARGES